MNKKTVFFKILCFICLQGDENVALLEELARKYAADLKTHFHHVLDTLLHLATKPESQEPDKVHSSKL